MVFFGGEGGISSILCCYKYVKVVLTCVCGFLYITRSVSLVVLRFLRNAPECNHAQVVLIDYTFLPLIRPDVVVKVLGLWQGANVENRECASANNSGWVSEYRSVRVFLLLANLQHVPRQESDGIHAAATTEFLLSLLRLSLKLSLWLFIKKCNWMCWFSRVQRAVTFQGETRNKF